MKEVLKKYTFLVLLASEIFLSPNVLKVYFFHVSSVLHFVGNFENFQSLKFVKSSKSMLKEVQMCLKCTFSMLLVYCISWETLKIFNH